MNRRVINNLSITEPSTPYVGGFVFIILKNPIVMRGQCLNRIAGIDAFEIDQKCKHGKKEWKCGVEAKEFLPERFLEVFMLSNSTRSSSSLGLLCKLEFSRNLQRCSKRSLSVVISSNLFSTLSGDYLIGILIVICFLADI